MGEREGESRKTARYFDDRELLSKQGGGHEPKAKNTDVREGAQLRTRMAKDHKNHIPNKKATLSQRKLRLRVVYFFVKK
jgi:hypothetical protein